MQARLKGQQEMKQDWNTIFNWYFLMEKANSLVSLPLQFNLVQEESDSHHMLLPFLVNRAKKPSDALKIERHFDYKFYLTENNDVGSRAKPVNENNVIILPRYILAFKQAPRKSNQGWSDAAHCSCTWTGVAHQKKKKGALRTDVEPPNSGG